MLIYKTSFILGILILVPQTPVGGLPRLNIPQLPNLKTFLFPTQWRRTGFFTDDPLSTVQRSFKDIQNNVGRSMNSLLAAGSAIRKRMFGMITGSAYQGPPPHYQSPKPVRPLVNNNLQYNSVHAHNSPSHKPSSGQAFPNFDDCDCHFGNEIGPQSFTPYTPVAQDDTIIYNEVKPHSEEIILQIPNTQDIDSYGAPVSNTQNIDSYGAPVAPIKTEYIPINEVYVTESNVEVEDSYGTPIAPVYTPVQEEVAPVYNPVKEEVAAPVHEPHVIPLPEVTVEHPKGGHNPHVPNILAHENDISHEAVIHPGGSKDIDVHKVEVLGAASVVQAPSASVPDQTHPEKYLNFDSDLLQDIVEVNLWYKDTKKLKHHKKGEKLKVIPHLHVR